VTKKEAQTLMLKHGISVNDLIQAHVPMIRSAILNQLKGDVKNRRIAQKPITDVIGHTIERIARERQQNNS